MPYCTKDIRELIRSTGLRNMTDSGRLNYVLTEIIKEYLVLKGLTYQTCNDIVGALDNCKDEFKRRIQDPYEDLKITQNGDVYSSFKEYVK